MIDGKVTVSLGSVGLRSEKLQQRYDSEEQCGVIGFGIVQQSVKPLVQYMKGRCCALFHKSQCRKRIDETTRGEKALLKNEIEGHDQVTDSRESAG